MKPAATAHPFPALIDTALSFFYPDICQCCRRARATREQSYVCFDCRSGTDGVRFIKPPFCDRCGLPFEGDISSTFECGNCREMELHFESARAAVVAKGIVREAIHKYKYRDATWFEPFLAELLIRQARPELSWPKPDLLVPVPLHPLRRREREFNQAERIAARLGEALDIPVARGLLERIRPTSTQTTLTRTERARNMRRAFRLRRPADLSGRRIVIVDDVLTTGATTSACARVLRGAGASFVRVWTVARGV